MQVVSAEDRVLRCELQSSPQSPAIELVIRSHQCPKQATVGRDILSLQSEP